MKLGMCPMILETAVGPPDGAFGRVSAAKQRGGRPGACNEARQRQARDRTCQRVRSDVTRKVNVIEGRKSCIHAAFIKALSGQLRFPG